MIWMKDGKKVADEGEIMREATRALQAELNKTGELESSWLYNKEVLHADKFTKEGLQGLYDNSVSSAQNKVDNIEQSLAELGQLSGSAKQEAINAAYVAKGYPPPLVVDGKDGSATKQALAKLNESLNYDLGNAKDGLAKYSQSDNPQAVAEGDLYQSWIGNQLKEQVQFHDADFQNNLDELHFLHC